MIQSQTRYRREAIREALLASRADRLHNRQLIQHKLALWQARFDLARKEQSK